LEKELNLGNHIAKYYKSFSGTDTLAFIMMPGSSPVVLGSLTTISYSMYRNKKPVINIGRTNINGVTRGSRIFAGTMIFTLINQHWLKEVQEQLDWLKGFNELKVDELPLFDIMIVSANEYGNAVTMYIYGIDFTDEAQTISVEDLFTENVFSFVARDISNFRAFSPKAEAVSKGGSNDVRNTFSQKLYVLNSSTIGLDDLAKLEKEMTLSKIIQLKQETKRHTLARELYHSSAKLMMGNDVSDVQELLNKTKLMTLDVNGIFDATMDEAVRKYQSYIGADINGVVDDKLYNSLANQVVTDGTRLGVVVNKYGAFVYKHASLHADIVDVKAYKEQVTIHEVVTSDDSTFHKWYKINTGYVLDQDIYSSYYTGSIIEFPTLEYNDSGVYVMMVQSALSQIYPAYTGISGLYDYETQQHIKKLQKDNGMIPTGIVDYNTWLLLQSLSGNVNNELSNDNFKIDLQTPPGIYDISSEEVLNVLHDYSAIISCDNFINIKTCAIALYDDGTSETFTKTFSIKEKFVVSLHDFRNAFVYNPKLGKTPVQVDYIIYPYNKKSYKWTIMYS
jgi:peptidoglycan hydrolase-like protein with peptidoglycan-binding domain